MFQCIQRYRSKYIHTYTMNNCETCTGIDSRYHEINQMCKTYWQTLVRNIYFKQEDNCTVNILEK